MKATISKENNDIIIVISPEEANLIAYGEEYHEKMMTLDTLEECIRDCIESN